MSIFFNPRWDGSGGITVDLNHPEFGSVPFTVLPDTGESHTQEMWETLQGRDDIGPYTAPDEDDPRATMVLPRMEFAQRAAEAGHITWPEATAWATGSELPQIAQDLINAAPAASRDRLAFTLLASMNVRRLAPEIVTLAGVLNLTDEEVDALFTPLD